jgi:hypothetical protein
MREERAAADPVVWELRVGCSSGFAIVDSTRGQPGREATLGRVAEVSVAVDAERATAARLQPARVERDDSDRRRASRWWCQGRSKVDPFAPLEN